MKKFSADCANLIASSGTPGRFTVGPYSTPYEDWEGEGFRTPVEAVNAAICAYIRCGYTVSRVNAPGLILEAYTAPVYRLQLAGVDVDIDAYVVFSTRAIPIPPRPAGESALQDDAYVPPIPPPLAVCFVCGQGDETGPIYQSGHAGDACHRECFEQDPYA